MKVNALLGSVAYQAAAGVARGREGPVQKPDRAQRSFDPAPQLSVQARAEAEKERASSRKDDADVERLVEAANRAIAHMKHRVEIQRDEPTKRFVVKLLDDKGVLVRQYPAEEFLAMSERLQELRGMLFASQG